MAIQTPIPLNRKVKYFAAAVDESTPYIKASRSYLADQLSGKKFGGTYFFYFPDPGVATVGTTDLSIEDINKSVFERVAAAQITSAKTAVDLTAWNKMQEIEDFVQEIAAPRGRRLAAEIEKDVIAKNIWISDNAVVSELDADGKYAIPLQNILVMLSSKMAGIKAAGKKVGFFHPNVTGQSSANFLNLFIPQEIQSKIYNDYSLGRYAGVDWVVDNFIPVVEVGETAPAITAASYSAPSANNGIAASDGTITVTGTNLFVGAAFTATYTDPTDGVVKPYRTVDLNGMTTVMREKKTFIVASVNATGTSGTLAGTFRFSQNGANVLQTNPSVEGDQSALAAATFTSVLTAGKTYYVVQVRDHDWLEWDTSKFPDLPGCENGSNSVSGITVQTAEWGDVKNRVSTLRVDVPYVALGVDARLSRLAYIELSDQFA